MKLKELFSNVKKRITPSKGEKNKLLRVFEEFKKKLSIYFDDKDIVLLGSVAKDTFLKGEHDLDVFILFNKSTKKEDAASTIFSALKKLNLEYEKKYAEHPYARIDYRGIKIDLVPAYKIKEGEMIKSAVDRSLFHYKFIKKNLKKEQRGEVRLLKKLLKNFGIYGAEVGIGGFSGYLCELLIIKYKNLENLLKEAKTWNRPRLRLGREETELFDEPMVFVDPTDKYRNVASPVREESLSRFILISSSLLKKPEIGFFFIDKVESYTAEFGKTILISFPSPDVVEETKRGQLKRIENSLRNYLTNVGFIISNSFIYDNGKKSWIVMSSPNTLNKHKKVYGPEIWMEKNVTRFIEKNPSYIEGNKVVGIKRIEKTSLKENIVDFLKKYNFPSYYRNGWVVEDKIYNKDLKTTLEIEKKRYYLMVGRWKRK